MSVIGPVLVNGEPVSPEAATISALDIGFQRGYGCFETMRSYTGYPFRMAQHLDRLEASAAKLRMGLASRAELEKWSASCAGEGDVAVKLFVSGGRDADAPGFQSATVVYAESLPDLAGPVRLMPLAAPWHPDGLASELTGAKTLSYAPNIAARLAAIDAGFDDALLIGSSGHVLEGPTSGIGWIKDNRFYHPTLELGVLASVTVAAVVELAPTIGLELCPGHYELAQLLDADEVIVMSTLSEVRPVAAVGDHVVGTGGVADQLRAAFADLVAAERHH